MFDRRLRREGEGELTRPPVSRADSQRPAADSILVLHDRAGNRAVASLLTARGRAPTRVPVQRDTPAKTPGPGKGTDGKTSASGTMSIPDLKLSLPILSFSQQVRGTNREKETAGDATVTIALSDLDPRLSEAAAKGRRFDTITITIGSGTTLTLHGVFISGVNIGAETVGLSFSFDSISRENRPPDEGPRDWEGGYG
jgi:hypothetical protein